MPGGDAGRGVRRCGFADSLSTTCKLVRWDATPRDTRERSGGYHMPLLTPRGGNRIAPAEPSERVEGENAFDPSQYTYGTLVSLFSKVDDLPDDASGPAGALVLTLHHGKDLVSADRNGLSDPFLAIRHEGAQSQPCSMDTNNRSR